MTARLPLIVIASAMMGGAANAEPLRPFTCATGFTNATQHVVFGNVQGVNKAAAYLARVVIHCYKKKTVEQREACIVKARDRHYQWTLAFKYNKPDCLDKAAIIDSTIARMRSFADRIYCDGGHSKCQKRAATVSGDLALRLIGLHMGYWQPFWVDGTCCQVYEDPAKLKFNNQLERLPDDCPPCLDMTTFADDLDQHIDDHNGETYCATESELHTQQ
jgi:hypothetical protein